MSQSDKRFPLDSLVQPTSVPDPSLRLSLLHQCVELLRELTCTVPPDPPSDRSEEVLEESKPSDFLSDPAMVSVASGPTLALSEYGDETSLHEARMEALDVFDSRLLDMHSYVVLWMDTVQVWGTPMFLCLGATEEGYRHILGFVEAPARDVASMKQLLCTLRNRGVQTESGLLCITSGDAQLSRLIPEMLHPVRLQSCQYRKRERVLSYLGDADFARIKGAMIRAYEIPVYEQAHSALLQVHADLLHCNRSAAQWFKQDLEQTLTLHRTGQMDQLSRSLRSTRSVVRAAQQLNRRLKGIRRWLGPTSRRAQIALVCMEMELRMRRLSHASALPALRTALFAESADTSEPESV